VVVKRRKAAGKKRAAAPAPAPRALRYKVVELSNVDERGLEHAVNLWVGQGWTFDGVQFAMRESSKRPSMAFVFFTREGAPLADATGDEQFRSDSEADRHLRRLVLGPETVAGGAEPAPVDAWTRLAQLAGEDE
jgi:hypothetical protein